MRGRKKTPEGKRVTICLKVSEATAAKIDSARSSRTRSAWLQELIDRALSGTSEAR